MKKTLLYLVFVVLGITPIAAQTPLTTAVNITATDVDGNPFDLFTTLDAGKWVVLDFMYSTCGPCQLAAPKFYQAFVNYGSNNPSAQIVFVSINRDDDNATMHNWEATYMNASGPYPKGISGTQGSATAGPQSFYNDFGIGAFPTFILIEPNRHIAEQDMWPIASGATFTTYFQAHGLNPFVGVDEINTTTGISVFPVPAQNEISVTSGNQPISEIEIFDQLGKVIFSQSLTSVANQTKVNVSAFIPGIYYARVKTGNGFMTNIKFVKI